MGALLVLLFADFGFGYCGLWLFVLFLVFRSGIPVGWFVLRLVTCASCCGLRLDVIVCLACIVGCFRVCVFCLTVCVDCVFVWIGWFGMAG